MVQREIDFFGESNVNFYSLIFWGEHFGWIDIHHILCVAKNCSGYSLGTHQLAAVARKISENIDTVAFRLVYTDLSLSVWERKKREKKMLCVSVWNSNIFTRDTKKKCDVSEMKWNEYIFVHININSVLIIAQKLRIHNIRINKYICSLSYLLSCSLAIEHA